MPIWIDFDGLATVGRDTLGSQGRIFAGPWARVTARKAAICQLTGENIRKGDLVYKPITNGVERMQRVLADALEAHAAADKRHGIVKPVHSTKFPGVKLR